MGRAAETSELDDQFRRSLRGEFRSVLIDGEPGVGKTRLASAFLTRHRVRAVTLRARGHPSGGATSFGMWAEVFDSHLRSRSRDEVTRLCGGLVEDLAGLLRTAAMVRGSWRADLLPMRIREALTVLLANIARERPVVILLDDIHLADASSWEVLGYLARNLADARVLVVACARLDEVVERSVGRHVLFGLEQEGVLSQMLLRPLQDPHVRELAERVLARPSVPSALVTWLFTESQGNPLFAVTLLEALLSEGADLTAPSLAEIPRALADRIAPNVEGLDPQSRETLELLAVVGRPVNDAELRRFRERRGTTRIRGWIPWSRQDWSPSETTSRTSDTRSATRSSRRRSMAASRHRAGGRYTSESHACSWKTTASVRRRRITGGAPNAVTQRPSRYCCEPSAKHGLGTPSLRPSSFSGRWSPCCRQVISAGSTCSTHCRRTSSGRRRTTGSPSTPLSA